ncbi:signal recognition particle (SRP) subunit family protein [Babesia bovis T2Bo]|uniref:Signal recognition particle subunit SRP72 n=1 Tax=Babesia bovis TaxID=5865 RepID=A7AWU7_BABBO|nr:signal recognition particle (SRP) subunit family protein [Babesia bovis T2Bo]EDO05525.1 signal recognition particle (SRP) subunit family protein [Babesia bovis T2Bo]|eukprot:XP_001609093.1 hypothetical protein [Babesia bovis T2Bo]
MGGKTAFSMPVDQALREVKRLIDECQFAEASRLCLQAIRVHGGVNAFYRAKCYCDLQLRRWHSCLETVRWLHNYMDHPSIADVSSKRCPKRLRTEARERRAEENVDLVNVLREAAGPHIINGECQWLHFEQAYCYYKMGHFESAFTSLRLCSSGERPFDLHKPSSASSVDSSTEANITLDRSLSPKYNYLLAQVYVRLGRFESARDLYTAGQSSSQDPLVSLNLLSTNLHVVSSLDHDGKEAIFTAINRDIDMKVGEIDSLSYEYTFNWSISKLLECDYSKSEMYLDLSEESLSAELKNDLGELPALRNQPEFMPLDALRVFLLHKRGNDDLARTRNEALLSTYGEADGVDPGTMLIVLNNCLCLLPKGQSFTELSNLEALLKRRNVVCKFGRNELLDVHHNMVAHLIDSGDITGSRAHIRKFMDRLRNEEVLHHSIACADYVEGKIDASISTLKRGILVHPRSMLLIRSLLYVLISARRYKCALRALQEYGHILKKCETPVLYWSILLHCHIYMGNAQGVLDALTHLVDECSFAESSEAIKRGCSFLESHDMHNEALSIYHKLYSSNPDNISVYCGVLFNESHLPQSHESAVSLESKLLDPFFSELRFIDAEELESAGELTYVQQVIEVNKPSKTRKRRRRHTVDTSRGPPDPERWLPKYERSAFKKQLKRKKEMVKGHSQGATSDVGASKPTSGTIHAESSNMRRRRNKKR